ncbi:MAG: type II secretion system minor pseudopilin GspK [Xanthomonadales bacterium]|nr:type II secretion system minor pseudopilin GspK [Xanthomonadales bacterium]
MKRARGAALLMALLVTAIAAALATRMLLDTQLDTGRTTELTRQIQARQLTAALEDWAMAILDRDAQATPGFDAPGDAWTQPLPATPIPGGMLTGRLQDLSGRINLNGLVDPVTGEDRPVAVQRFRRLVIEVLALDSSVADQVLDLLDPDGVPRRSGYEPGHAGQVRVLAHPAELRVLPALDARAWAVLEPHVTALPPDASLNVNMASPAVLQALAPDMDNATAARLVRGAGDAWTTLQVFVDAAAAQGVDVDQDGLDVRSRGFLAEAFIEHDQRAFQWQAVLVRGGLALGQASEPRDAGGPQPGSRYHVRYRRLAAPWDAPPTP